MTERTTRLSRRSFLLTLGAGGVATAAVIAAKGPAAIPVSKDKRTSRGYHATAHVDNYYRSAKL